MVVQGQPLTTIALAVGRPPAALKRMIDGSLRHKIEEVRALVIRETSTHWHELTAMLPQARLNMQTALLSTDERTRVDMSKWIHDAVVPRPTQRHEHEATVNLGEGTGELLTEIRDRLGEISQANQGRSGLARVRSGREAVPRPVVDAEPSKDDAA
jgi:hypothetical protein